MLAAVRALPRWALMALLGGFGCAKAPPAPIVDDAGTGRATREPPRSALETTAPPTQTGATPAVPRGARPPQHGCVLRGQQSLGPGERGLAVYLGAEPAVWVVAPDRRQLVLWMARPGVGFAPGPELALEAAFARGAARCDPRCDLAWVDERGRLFGLTFDGARLGSPRPLASGVDRRFAPALGRQGERRLYAYTSNVDDVMHTTLLVDSAGKLSTPRDLTPPGHGAAAPTFVLGSQAPILVAIDARAGLSPLLEWSFDAAGTPREAQVRTPVSQPYAPPLLGAVLSRDDEIEVAYTAIGRAAMTAVGRVPLRRAVEPVALAASRGYGELAFSQARSRRSALFALEVPSAAAPDAKRTLALKLLSAGEVYEAAALDGGDAGARRPSLASGPEPGEFTLAYTRGDAVEVAAVSCDD